MREEKFFLLWVQNLEFITFFKTQPVNKKQHQHSLYIRERGKRVGRGGAETGSERGEEKEREGVEKETNSDDQ